MESLEAGGVRIHLLYSSQVLQLAFTVVALCFLFNLAIGLYYKRRAGTNVCEFFLSGRDFPWCLAGTSMVATIFAADMSSELSIDRIVYDPRT